MTAQQALIDTLAPLAHRVSELDLSDPATAAATLEAEFPVAELGAVRSALFAGRDAGWLTPRRASETLTFGRVAKPTEATYGQSIDAVDMSGAGAEHVHPNGEVSLCFSETGDPRFCGHPEGWVVVGPGSQHIPEVTGGRMLIVYFLPGGAMQWV